MKVILDSSCDLPDEYLKKYDIDVIPVHIHIEKKEYLDRYEIKAKEIYDYLRKHEELPTTSAPNPKEFLDKINLYVDEYQKIMIGTMSAKVSGTFQAAHIASKRFDSKQIKLLDSKSGSGILGLLGINAVKMEKKGLEEEEICQRIDKLRDESIMVGYIDNVRNLMKSGRISKFKYFMANLINAKPILTYEDGEIVPVTSGRGKENSLEKLIEALVKKAEPNQMYDIMITHADDKETVDKLMKAINKELSLNEKIINFLTPALAIHLGLGTILVSIVPTPFE